MFMLVLILILFFILGLLFIRIKIPGITPILSFGEFCADAWSRG